MKHSYLVSIIIPVYNAENYIGNCLSSILKQTYRNIEIILVNDGSTDESRLICNEYAERDNRIIIIDQKNSGPSEARNHGIRKSNGDYIQFVDSDDTIESNMVEKLVESMENQADLVICGYNSLRKSANKTVKKIVIPNKAGLLDKKGFLSVFGKLHKERLVASLWNKLYNSEVIKSSQIQFVKDLTVGEDLLFNLDYIGRCHKVNLVNEPLYNYLIYNNSSSLTGNFKKDYYKTQRMLYEEIIKFLEKEGSFTNENKYFLRSKFGENIVSWIDNLFHENSNLDFKGKKKEIDIMISDENVRNNIFENKDTIQKKVLAFFVKYKSINMIYLLFKIKSLLRKRISFLFNIIKRILN